MIETTAPACACNQTGRFNLSVTVAPSACMICGGTATPVQTRRLQDLLHRETLGHKLPLEAFLSPGDGVVDIGANTGDRARKFAEAVGPLGHVVALEPDPVVAEACRLSCAELSQVEVWPAAVRATNERVLLHRDGTDSRRSSVYQENVVQYGGEMVAVESVTLDEIAPAVPKLRAIKVDAQGSEVEILKGATATLKRTRLVWHVELWPVGLQRAGTSAGDLAGLFLQAGYQPVIGNWWRVLEWAKQASGQEHLDLVLWCPL